MYWSWETLGGGISDPVVVEGLQTLTDIINVTTCTPMPSVETERRNSSACCTTAATLWTRRVRENGRWLASGQPEQPGS